MKKLLLVGIMSLSAITGFSQNTATVDNLKEQQKVRVSPKTQLQTYFS